MCRLHRAYAIIQNVCSKFKSSSSTYRQHHRRQCCQEEHITYVYFTHILYSVTLRRGADVKWTTTKVVLARSVVLIPTCLFVLLAALWHVKHAWRKSAHACLLINDRFALIS